ncbi:MAG: hypothetical protein QOI10_1905 [Solirubrobacterales bacterium]|jgi:hypothetical protein|nr:hypothetical protein [Solirubrobacterales bacterium]
MTALMMNMAEQRNKELRDYAQARRLAGRRRRTRTAPPASGLLEQVSIRRLGDADGEALKALAGRDSSPVPGGELLGAELSGRLIAVVSITSGQSVADPFTPTTEVRSLLELRAAQVRDTDARGHHRRLGLRALSARPRRS